MRMWTKTRRSEKVNWRRGEEEKRSEDEEVESYKVIKLKVKREEESKELKVIKL